MINRMLCGLAALIGAVALTLGLTAGTASAHHNEVAVNFDLEGCQLTGETSWTIEDHKVGNTSLVVLVGDEVSSTLVGEPVSIDLDPGTNSVKWRVFGGGERDYDSPHWGVTKEEVNAYGAEHGWAWTTGASGLPEWVTWHTFEVTGCPAPSPDPTETPSPDPTETPSPDPTPSAEPTKTPSATPDPVAGELPVTSGVRLLPALLIGGFLLVGLGAGLYYVTRRRVDPTP